MTYSREKNAWRVAVERCTSRSSFAKLWRPRDIWLGQRSFPDGILLRRRRLETASSLSRKVSVPEGTTATAGTMGMEEMATMGTMGTMGTESRDRCNSPSHACRRPLVTRSTGRYHNRKIQAGRYPGEHSTYPRGYHPRSSYDVDETIIKTIKAISVVRWEVLQTVAD